MRDFDELVREAELAPIEGWNFGWLDGRAIEERPSWHYFDRVAERTAGVATLLEVQAGVGSMIGTLPSLPSLAVATEGFPSSVAVATPLLRSRGAHLVVTSQTRAGLPFAQGSFELVISRHPIGSYFAQHVGPQSLRSLSEFLMGPLADASKRDPDAERCAAEDAGMVVTTLELERPRTVFFDIGAVVYFLRLVPWIVPGFSVARYREALGNLHSVMQGDGGFETTASRMLVDARKPYGGAT